MLQYIHYFFILGKLNVRTCLCAVCPIGWQEANVGDDVQRETRHSQRPWDWKSSTKNCHQVSLWFFMMFNILSCIYIYSECSVILRIQGCGAVVQRCENTSENNRRLGEGSWLLRTEEGQASFLCLQERLYRCAEKDRGEGHSHQQHCKGHCKSTYGFILYYINSTSTPT